MILSTKTRLRRPLSFATLASINLDKYDHMQTIELNHVNFLDLSMSTTKENMTVWFETLDSHLLQTHRINDIPLSYVVRDKVIVQLHATDPSTNYGNETGISSPLFSRHNRI